MLAPHNVSPGNGTPLRSCRMFPFLLLSVLAVVLAYIPTWFGMNFDGPWWLGGPLQALSRLELEAPWLYWSAVWAIAFSLLGQALVSYVVGVTRRGTIVRPTAADMTARWISLHRRSAGWGLISFTAVCAAILCAAAVELSGARSGFADWVCYHLGVWRMSVRHTIWLMRPAVLISAIGAASLILGILFLVGGGGLKRLLHSHWGNTCFNCGYDLRSSPKQCPECGTAIA